MQKRRKKRSKDDGNVISKFKKKKKKCLFQAISDHIGLLLPFPRTRFLYTFLRIKMFIYKLDTQSRTQWQLLKSLH